MADIQEAIRRLRYIFTSEGADKVVADQAKVTTTLASTDKASLSLDKTFANLERRYVSGVRAQQDYEKVQRQVNAAVQQNPALQDRANAILSAAAERYNQASFASRAFAAATSGVSGQLIALSAGAGPVGTFLAALGPWGLAASVGLGAARVAISGMADAADRLAGKAVQLKNFETVTGLTTTQIQVLQEAGSDFGLTAQDVSGFVEHFATQLTDLRTASGPLYDILRKISPELAQQALTAKGVAAQIDILSAAYKRAGEDAPALLKAAGGRSGTAAAPLIDAVSTAGGMEAMSAAMNKASFLTYQQADALRKLKAENDSLGEHIRDNIASIFSDAVLRNQVESRKAMEGITQAMRDFSISDAWSKFTYWVDSHGGILSKLFGADKMPGQTASGGVSVPTIPVTNGGALPPATVSREDPTATANKYKEVVTALGSAATASERYNQRVLTLKASLAEGKIDQETYNRAVAGANVELGSGAINARIGALGEMASVSDALLQKQYAINKANLEGANITGKQSEKILELLRNRQLGIDVIKASTDAQNVEAATIGMSAGAVAEYTAVQNRLNEAKRNGQILTAEEVAAIKQSAAALGEAAQRTDNLKAGYSIFSGTMQDLNQQIRQNGLSWNTLGTVATNALGRISDKLMQMATDKLWANAMGGATGGGGLFSGLFNGLFGGGSSSAPTNVVGGAGSLSVPTFHEGGIAGLSATPSRYVHPAYFDTAPRYHDGIDFAGGEMPAVLKKGEEVGWPSQLAEKYGGKSSGDTFHYNDNRTFNDVTPQVMAQIESRMRQERPVIIQEAMKALKKQRAVDPNTYSAG